MMLLFGAGEGDVVCVVVREDVDEDGSYLCLLWKVVAHDFRPICSALSVVELPLALEPKTSKLVKVVASMRT